MDHDQCVYITINILVAMQVVPCMHKWRKVIMYQLLHDHECNMADIGSVVN